MDILNWLITIGAIALCLGLALLGLQFICMLVGIVVTLVYGLVYGLVSAIKKFLTTKP